ncbi:basic proline-rich protein-like [Symphalangus syndactylus]|uniref:basic proline-rich protein-like n=1 Tax=Symphalangus syndactylus TaxID=9590 RepID=UPI00300552A8
MRARCPAIAKLRRMRGLEETVWTLLYTGQAWGLGREEPADEEKKGIRVHRTHPKAPELLTPSLITSLLGTSWKWKDQRASAWDEGSGFGLNRWPTHLASGTRPIKLNPLPSGPAGEHTVLSRFFEKPSNSSPAPKVLTSRVRRWQRGDRPERTGPGVSGIFEVGKNNDRPSHGRIFPRGPPPPHPRAQSAGPAAAARPDLAGGPFRAAPLRAAPSIPPRIPRPYLRERGCRLEKVLGSGELPGGRAQRLPGTAGSPARSLLMACRARALRPRPRRRPPPRSLRGLPAGTQLTPQPRKPSSPPPPRPRTEPPPAPPRAQPGQRQPAPPSARPRGRHRPPSQLRDASPAVTQAALPGNFLPCRDHLAPETRHEGCRRPPGAFSGTRREILSPLHDAATPTPETPTWRALRGDSAASNTTSTPHPSQRAENHRRLCAQRRLSHRSSSPGMKKQTLTP